MSLLRQASQERLSEDMTFILKIWVIPGRENNMSKGFKAGKKVRPVLEPKGGQSGERVELS